MENIYVVRGTEQAGPFTESDIRAQLAAGTITGDSLIWWDGLPEWTALSKTPLGAAPSVNVAAPAPAAVPAPAPTAAVAAPGATKTSTLAIVSLVLGILGLPMLLCWIIGLPLQIAAIITGHLAVNGIKKDPSTTGKGIALGGLVCGYLGIVLLVLLFVFAIAFGSHLKDILQTIQSQAAAATNNAPATPNP